MIPEFPNFKKIEISDREAVERFTHQYVPYSDFNFTSMWCWSGKNDLELSQLDANLIVKFCDYIHGKEFYSYLGQNNVSKLAESLIKHSLNRDFDHVLKLVPEDSVRGLDASLFKVEESLDNFDYILSTEHLVEMNGSKLHNHAGFKRKFLELHREFIKKEVLNSCTTKYLAQLTDLAELWIKNKIREEKEVAPEPELIALRRICELETDKRNFSILTVYHDKKAVAFTIDELLDDEYAIRHFMKADTSYKGIYSYIVSESAKILLESGKKYLNIEQDLGLANLRQAKKSYRPVQFLKKYTVSKSS